MAAPKNHAKAGGRKKGTPNKITTDLKEFYVAIMDKNKDRIDKALDDLYRDDPYKYLMAIDKLSQKVIANKRDITSADESIAPSVTIIENRDQSKRQAK
jgi:hypothetical protein